ncbi:ALP1-like protein [Tanacetum coccineum]
MRAPLKSHFDIALKVLKYLKLAPRLGVEFSKRKSDCVITAFSDSDWVKCPVTRRSISGYCVFINGNLVSWKSKRHATLSKSSAEAEYRSMASTTCVIMWIVKLLGEFGIKNMVPVDMYCDNKSTIQIAANPAAWYGDEFWQTHLGEFGTHARVSSHPEGIFGLLKCTSSIRQLAYGVHAEFLDEYMQISERTSRTALDHFCQAVMQIYGPEYLRKPTVTDVEKLYLHTKEKHGFPGMLGSLDSPRFFFVANSELTEVNYLVDGIYPELAPLVKTIAELADDDHKRILYKQKQESASKDVERAFGVLKKKWAILANPTRALKKERIINMMYTCIILHNMIRKYKKYAISPTCNVPGGSTSTGRLRFRKRGNQVQAVNGVGSDHPQAHKRFDTI